MATFGPWQIATLFEGCREWRLFLTKEINWFSWQKRWVTRNDQRVTIEGIGTFEDPQFTEAMVARQTAKKRKS